MTKHCKGCGVDITGNISNTCGRNECRDSLTETIIDVDTGKIYRVDKRHGMASDVFPWLRGTEHDKPLTVGVMIEEGGRHE
ncbi:hypothetical protein [Pseudodesulfovibrio profundus]|uniref:hypothetical protein n=1 Tax=Pseudodesulfovibrio profundus TaxID=57320 RepID=UPI000BE2F20C|nr:hypothetical protein [Pseudodesulfovibrio profundus]